jgi:hypothetical protein
MTDERLRLVVIIGSTREGRFGPTVADWFVGEAKQHADMDVDVLDLADTALPDRLSGYGQPIPPQVAAVAPRLAAADAFATEDARRLVREGVAGQAGGVRVLRRDVGRPACGGAPSAGVRRGARDHGARHRELPRRVGPVRDEGRPFEEAECSAAAKTLLDQLAWWAVALRDARAARPYVTG